MIPISFAVTNDLIISTNSLGADDLDRHAIVREAIALGQTITALETLGVILIITGMVKLGPYHYHSWWR